MKQFKQAKRTLASGLALVLLMGPLAYYAAQTTQAQEEPPAMTTEDTGTGAAFDAATVYEINDTSDNLEDYLNEAKQKQAGTVRLLTTISGPGDATFYPEMKVFQGWNGSYFGEKGPKIQTLASTQKATLIFPMGSNLTVDHIRFGKLSSVKIEAGATVRFKNCTFQTTPTNEGTAVFEDSVFETGQITNNGVASYTGTTVEPENIGQAKTGHEPLSLTLAPTEIPATVVKQAVDQSVAATLSGSNKAEAKLTAKLEPADSGLTVSVVDQTIHVKGEASKPGTYQLTATATAPGEQADQMETVTAQASLRIYEQLQVRLVGKLQAFVSETIPVKALTPPTANPSGIALFIEPARMLGQLMHRERTVRDLVGSGEFDTVTMATGAVGPGAGGSIGPNTATNTVKVEVKTGAGEFEPWSDFSAKHPEAKLTGEITGPGSGLKAHFMLDSFEVRGTPDQPGQYQLQATLTEGPVSVQSEPVRFRIYDPNVTLKERLSKIGDTADWEIEPYQILTTDNPVLPTTLKTIIGSDTSGTYASIGNYERADSETITIPEGADVTLKNMKILSSVRIIVEKGGKLTLDDSGVYGPIEVRGGTLSAKNSAATTNQIILEEGSTLEDLELRSHGYYLTDGNLTRPIPDSVIVVNGPITVKGKNKIQGSEGTASKPGQTALEVGPEGVVTVEEGATLEAIGGGAESFILAPTGGHGIRLDKGTITGPGTVIATGGPGHQKDGQGGNGISGEGTVSVAHLTLNPGKVFGVEGNSSWAPGQQGQDKSEGVTVKPYEGKAESNEPAPDAKPPVSGDPVSGLDSDSDKPSEVGSSASANANAKANAKASEHRDRHLPDEKRLATAAHDQKEQPRLAIPTTGERSSTLAGGLISLALAMAALGLAWHEKKRRSL